MYTVLKAKFTVRTSLDSLLCMLLPDLTLYVNIRIPFQKFCHFFYLYLIAGSGDWGEGNWEVADSKKTEKKEEIVNGAHHTTTRIRETIQSPRWYILNFDLTGIVEFGAYLWLIQPNCGRIRSTKPRRKPAMNPPRWAKLSTFGRIPTARLIAIMTTRVIRAAAWRYKHGL